MFSASTLIQQKEVDRINILDLSFDSIKILHSILTNIKQHPKNEKVRRIKTTLPRMVDHIMKFREARDVLKVCGFVLVENEYYFVLKMETDLCLLRVFQKKIHSRIQQMKKEIEEKKKLMKKKLKRKKKFDSYRYCSIEFSRDCSNPIISDDCLMQIIQYLDEPFQILLLRRISQQFYHRASENIVWREMILRRRPHISRNILNKNENLISFFFRIILPDSQKKYLKSEKTLLMNWEIKSGGLNPTVELDESIYLAENEEMSEEEIEKSVCYCFICKKSFIISDLPEEDKTSLKSLILGYKFSGYSTQIDHIEGFCSKECFQKDIAEYDYTKFHSDDIDDSEVNCRFRFHVKGFSGSEVAWSSTKSQFYKIESDYAGIGHAWFPLPFASLNIQGFIREERSEVYKLLDEEDSRFLIGKLFISYYNRMTEVSVSKFVYFLYKE